jgi:hypothetical protein
MKQVLFILAFTVFSYSTYAQTQLPKLESVITLVQQEEYVCITDCLVKINYRIEGRKYSLPLFKDKEDNLFCVIMKNGHLELVPSESFDYAQN